ncbi:hypothetical protein [Hydrogenophaga sp. ANAO-22]|uniref:hypothetical protein n=1 Tax=Hydrogenophaga sp. ANAO-22 TaxID=3166645 RepID=UPI0036D25747
MVKKFDRRPEDLGGMGESYFRLMAKDAGLVANASTDDKAGWDFEVEVPSPIVVDYTSQSKPVFRVQVKATMSAALNISMTFSSALSLIQFAGPAFILLYRFGNGPIPADAYLFHIDQARAMDILKSLREREVAEQGFKVNKAKTTIRFEDTLRLASADGATLRRHLEMPLGGSFLDYLERKTKWLRGIETDSVLRRFDVQLEDDEAIQAMANCFLGFEGEFGVNLIEYSAPMGIPDRELIHSNEFLPTTIKPNEKGLTRGVIRVRTSEYGKSYEFKTTLFSVPKHLPKKYAAMRMKTALFDLIFRLESGGIQFLGFNLMDDKLRASVVELRNFIAYLAEIRESDRTIFDVVPDGEREPLRLELRTMAPSVFEGFDQIYTAMEAVYLKLASLGLTNELIRPADIFEKPAQFSFLAHVGQDYESPLSLEFQANEESKVDANVTIFCSPIDLSGMTVLCFGAFFGSIEILPGQKLLGKFSRSEYLGEIIVRSDQDVDAARKSQSEKYEEALWKRGFTAL